MKRLFCILILVFVGSFSWTSDAFAYPGGPKDQVANGGPYCASCHASLQPNTVRELPEKKIDEMLAKNRHYLAIEKGLKKYKSLSPEVRKELVRDVMAVDSNTSIKLDVPDAVDAGETFTVTVKTRGGGGPVIGIMLLDSDLRYQSSPPQTVGWSIVSPPEVIGPDGKKQTKWIDKRHNDVTKNINFVIVYGVESDPRKETYPEAEVTYTLKAPTLEGKLPLSAAILYGTETASPVGYKEEIWGKVPVGGFTASSGRIVFTEMKHIIVK